MPTNTHSAVQWEYLSPQWIYDTLMEQINPALMIENSKRLQDRYEGETDEARAMRFAGYEIDFLILNECLTDLEIETGIDASVLKKEMSAIIHEDSAKEDEQVVNKIAGELDQSDS